MLRQPSTEKHGKVSFPKTPQKNIVDFETQSCLSCLPSVRRLLLFLFYYIENINLIKSKTHKTAKIIR